VRYAKKTPGRKQPADAKLEVGRPMYPRRTCTPPVEPSSPRFPYDSLVAVSVASHDVAGPRSHGRYPLGIMQRGSARREPQASGHIKGQPHAPRDGRSVLGQASLFDALILPRRAVTERGWLWTTIDRESWNVDRRHHELGLRDGHIRPRLGSKAPAANVIRGMCPWQIPPREEQRLICTSPLIGRSPPGVTVTAKKR
jgi:hypothetical protein